MSLPVEEDNLNKARAQVERTIKAEMALQGVTQMDFAKKFKLSKTSISRAISGGGTPTSLMVRQMIYKELGMEQN